VPRAAAEGAQARALRTSDDRTAPLRRKPLPGAVGPEDDHDAAARERRLRRYAARVAAGDGCWTDGQPEARPVASLLRFLAPEVLAELEERAGGDDLAAEVELEDAGEGVEGEGEDEDVEGDLAAELELEDAGEGVEHEPEATDATPVDLAELVEDLDGDELAAFAAQAEALLAERREAAASCA